MELDIRKSVSGLGVKSLGGRRFLCAMIEGSGFDGGRRRVLRESSVVTEL